MTVSVPRQDSAASRRHDVRITARSVGGVLVVTVEGEADLATEHSFTDGLRRALSSPSSAVVLDLTRLTFTSASCVRVLVDASGSAEDAGVDVAVVGIGQRLAWMWSLNDSPVPDQLASVDQAVAVLDRRAADCRVPTGTAIATTPHDTTEGEHSRGASAPGPRPLPQQR